MYLEYPEHTQKNKQPRTVKYVAALCTLSHFPLSQGIHLFTSSLLLFCFFFCFNPKTKDLIIHDLFFSMFWYMLYLNYSSDYYIMVSKLTITPSLKMNSIPSSQIVHNIPFLGKGKTYAQVFKDYFPLSLWICRDTLAHALKQSITFLHHSGYLNSYSWNSYSKQYTSYTTAFRLHWTTYMHTKQQDFDFFKLFCMQQFLFTHGNMSYGPKLPGAALTMDSNRKIENNVCHAHAASINL